MSCRIDVHRYFNTERYEHHCHTAPLEYSHWMRNKRLRHMCGKIRNSEEAKSLILFRLYFVHPRGDRKPERQSSIS